MKTTYTLLALGLIAAASVFAQEDRPQRPPPSEGRSGEGRPGMRPPMGPPPLMMVLDANHDRKLDAEEIANASAALKKLDKNGDGQLTEEELFPPRPDGDRPEGRPGDRRPDRRDGDGGPRPRTPDKR
jgi:hypothetical protein